jgi:hypothetical protein
VKNEITPGSMCLARADDRPIFKTEYFPDGSAIVVTERSILLLEPVAEYEVKLPTNEPE